MWFRYIIIFCLLSVSATGMAAVVSGRVVDGEDGTFLYGAVVVLKNKSGAVVKYTETDKDGCFSLDVGGEVPADCRLEVRMMGYAVERLMPPFEEGMTVRMTVEKWKLNEVVVEAEKVEVRGDTISYIVPTILAKDDRVLSDVLKKIAGVDVDVDGRVQYNGKPIVKMYVENNDLLGSRYNIATQNLDPRDISAIEVYERHQPVKALEGIVGSDAAALNIKLKPSARSRWIAILEAQAGISPEAPHVPYSGRAFLMNVGRKFQTINTFRTDATGNNIVRSGEYLSPEVTSDPQATDDFYNRYKLKDYLGLSFFSAPLEDSRTRFNTSYSLSTDNTIAISEGYTLGVSADYENNVLMSERSVTQTYYNDDGTKLTSFREDDDSRFGGWYAAAGVRLKTNTSKLYLDNHLRFNMSGNNTSNALGGTVLRDESASGNAMDLLNDLSVVRRFSDRKYFSFSMLTQYSEQEESMSVFSSSESDSALQNVNVRLFYNDLSGGFRLRLGERLTLSSSTSLQFLWRDFRSSLGGFELPEGDAGVPVSMSNDINMLSVKPQERLSLNYLGRKTEFSVFVDAWYQYVYGMHKAAASPGMSFKYTFGQRLYVSANASYSLSSINEQEMFGGLIMQSYKYLSLGQNDLMSTPSYFVAASVNFRDPLSGWYLRGSVSYMGARSFETARYFVGDYIIVQKSDRQVPYSVLSVGGTAEKGLLDIAGKIMLQGGYSTASSFITQNMDMVGYVSRLAHAALGFEGEAARWLKIRYDGRYQYQRMEADTHQEQEAAHTFRQSLVLSFFPADKFALEIGGEHYLNRYQSRQVQNTVFVDASARYFISDKIELYLEARNLMNQGNYVNYSLMPMFTSVQEYSIRPLNVLLGLQIKF